MSRPIGIDVSHPLSMHRACRVSSRREEDPLTSTADPADPAAAWVGGSAVERGKLFPSNADTAGPAHARLSGSGVREVENALPLSPDSPTWPLL